LYLRPGGQFGYVMPWAVLPRPGQQSRGPHAGFRTGSYPTNADLVRVAFTQPWDLHRVKPSFFPLPVSVIFGRRQQPGASSVPLPERSKAFAGRFDTKRANWAAAVSSISIITAEPPPATGQRSPYAHRFTQGATVLPQFLFLVKPDEAPLGTVAGQRSIRSRRRPREKEPWKLLPDLRGAVEAEFIVPLYLGECILPFRCLAPQPAVIPWDGHRLLDTGDVELGRHPGLADWWHKAEVTWEQHRRGGSRRLSLMQRLNYQRAVTQQFPIPEYRVAYNASGSYLAAAMVTETSAVIEHKLYWGSAASHAEARYLTAILNSTILTMAVRPMQARGEHNPRDFDKYIFQLPIPQYDPGDSAHARLVALAERAENVAAGRTLPEVRFELQRKHIREALDRDGVGADINAIVKALLDIAT
jgi:hypothetical protein